MKHEMTFQKLKSLIDKSSNNKYFFSEKNLKFFGETLSSYRLLNDIVTVDNQPCYVVACIRSKRDFEPCKKYTYHHYFNVNTLDPVFPKEER